MSLCFLGLILAGCSEYRKPEAEIVQDLYRKCPLGMSQAAVDRIAGANEWQFGGGDREMAMTYYLGSYTSWPGEIFFALLPDSMMVFAIFTFDMDKLETITVRKDLDGP